MELEEGRVSEGIGGSIIVICIYIIYYNYA